MGEEVAPADIEGDLERLDDGEGTYMDGRPSGMDGAMSSARRNSI